MSGVRASASRSPRSQRTGDRKNPARSRSSRAPQRVNCRFFSATRRTLHERRKRRAGLSSRASLPIASTRIPSTDGGAVRTDSRSSGEARGAPAGPCEGWDRREGSRAVDLEFEHGGCLGKAGFDGGRRGPRRKTSWQEPTPGRAFAQPAGGRRGLVRALSVSEPRRVQPNARSRAWRACPIEGDRAREGREAGF